MTGLELGTRPGAASGHRGRIGAEARGRTATGHLRAKVTSGEANSRDYEGPGGRV